MDSTVSSRELSPDESGRNSLTDLLNDKETSCDGGVSKVIGSQDEPEKGTIAAQDYSEDSRAYEEATQLSSTGYSSQENLPAGDEMHLPHADSIEPNPVDEHDDSIIDQSAEELSSFNISDDENSLTAQMKELYLEKQRSEQTEQQQPQTQQVLGKNGSRHISVNTSYGAEAEKLMGTPGSIFTVKSNTTASSRPSSRNTLLNDTPKLNPARSERTVKPISPKRLHRVVVPDDNDDTFEDYGNENEEEDEDDSGSLQIKNIGEFLRPENIQDNVQDRVSNTQDITRLNKELIDCKVQIQLQQEIIRNDLLNKLQDPIIGDELIDKLNILSAKVSSGNLRSKYDSLTNDLAELQNINSMLIDQQEQKQNDYDQWCLIATDLLQSLKPFDENLNEDIERVPNSNLGNLLQVVSLKVRAVLSKLQELEDAYDASVIRSPRKTVDQVPDNDDDQTEKKESEEHETMSNISFSTTKTDSLTQLLNDNSKQREEIQRLSHLLIERNHKLRDQEENINNYKQTLHEFVSLLQQTLNGYINEFIGFHSDFLDYSSKTFENESIDDVLKILRDLVSISDKYQNDGELINLQNVRSIMTPVWSHNISVTRLLVEKYKSMADQNKELKQRKGSSNIGDSFGNYKSQVNQLKNEISDLKSQIRQLEDNQSSNNFSEIPTQIESESATTKLRLDSMIKKWKHAEESLAFERKAHNVKVKELEEQIKLLKMTR